jgi:hypothetical protein
VKVQDTGEGLDPQLVDQIFNASKRPSRVVWGWGFRSGALSWKITMDSSGPQPTARERPLNSLSSIEFAGGEARGSSAGDESKSNFGFKAPSLAPKGLQSRAQGFNPGNPASLRPRPES